METEKVRFTNENPVHFGNSATDPADPPILRNRCHELQLGSSLLHAPRDAGGQDDVSYKQAPLNYTYT